MSSEEPSFESEAMETWSLTRPNLPDVYGVKELVQAMHTSDTTLSRREAKNIVFEYVSYWSELGLIENVSFRPARWRTR